MSDSSSIEVIYKIKFKGKAEMVNDWLKCSAKRIKRTYLKKKKSQVSASNKIVPSNFHHIFMR